MVKTEVYISYFSHCYVMAKEACIHSI